jgi:hypothetical protein
MTSKEYTAFQIDRHEHDKETAHEICREIVRIMSTKKANKRIYAIVKEQLDHFVADSPLEFVDYPIEYF